MLSFPVVYNLCVSIALKCAYLHLIIAFDIIITQADEKVNLLINKSVAADFAAVPKNDNTVRKELIYGYN